MGITGLRRIAIPLLIVIAYGLLLVAWAIGNPPFAGADEGSHYQRAIGVGQGQLIGPKASAAAPVGATPDQLKSYQWINDAIRTVVAPGGLLLPDPACDGQRPTASAACLLTQSPIPGRTVVVTQVGNYQPEAYLLPGWALLHGTSPGGADRIGRLAGAFVALVFLGVGVGMLWTGERLSMTGLLVAVTPMVVFVDAIINPSGLEITTAIAFVSALLALSRSGTPSRWVWWATGLSGAALALSRSPGPIWVLIDLGVLVILMGLRGVGRLIAGHRFAAVACGLALAVAGAVNRWWEALYGSHLRLTAAEVAQHLRPAVRHLPNLLRQEIGDFGSLDSPLAWPFVAAWSMVTLGLVVVALMVGGRRERVAVVVATLFVPVVAVLFDAVFVSGTGFAAQGRHLLPLGVLVPLLAGEVIGRNKNRIHRGLIRPLILGVPVFVGVVQAEAWFGNARRQAVGLAGPLWFFSHAQWEPPLHWWIWGCVALAAAASLVWVGLRPTANRKLQPTADRPA